MKKAAIIIMMLLIATIIIGCNQVKETEKSTQSTPEVSADDLTNEVDNSLTQNDTEVEIGDMI